ncbi:MAG: hypothetical protein L0287_27030 [Anaerolineae bacterium]|nr:hypothetical protein [Anaerolineae bacterium]MCI0609521.1 hypothetical protein [Anaerolineae bacterium]
MNESLEITSPFAFTPIQIQNQQFLWDLLIAQIGLPAIYGKTAYRISGMQFYYIASKSLAVFDSP